MRFDGLNISAHMVNNNHARYIAQSLKAALPPGKFMEAIDKVSLKKTKNMTKLKSVSPQPGPSSASFEHNSELFDPINSIHYGAGDSVCDPMPSWADEIEEVDDVETCSSNSSNDYQTIDKSLNNSFNSNSSRNKNFESVSGRGEKNLTDLGVDQAGLGRSFLSETGASAVSSESSRDVATCSESEDDEVYSANDQGMDVNLNVEESVDSLTLTADDETTASGVTTPDIYEDAIQVKEVGVN